MKLNIGCGPLRYDGFVGVDLFPTEACDVQADIFALPVVNGSIEEILLDHVLEHQEYRKVTRLFREMRRVLQPTGKIVVGIPDFQTSCEAFIEACNEKNLGEQTILLRLFYGSQTHPGEYHKSGWSREMLSSVLKSTGFVVDEIYTDDRDEGYCCKAVARVA